MATMMGTQQIFEQLVELVGRKVEVGVKSTGKVLTGKVAYTSFDSFLLELNGNRTIVRFCDLLFLNPL